MKYDPQKHHRRSIRLKGYDYASSGMYFITICTYQRECLFGEIIDGEMQLNQFGNIARSHWQKLTQYHLNLQADEWVIMPNHIHGILVLTSTGVGAGLADKVSAETSKQTTKPAPTEASAPTKPQSISEIIRGFKTFSARRINQIRHIKGVPIWQRNYYKHIIRNEESLQYIRQYIQNNPLSWQQDQLHPSNPGIA